MFLGISNSMEEMCLLDTSAKSSLLNLAKVFLYLRARWERNNRTAPCPQVSYDHIDSSGRSAEVPRASPLKEIPGTVNSSFYSSICSQAYGFCEVSLFFLNLICFETNDDHPHSPHGRV